MWRRMQILLVCMATCASLLIPTLANAASSATSGATINGVHGESLSVSTTTASGTGVVKVIGKHFDETVGIYLAFCVLPAKGKLPSPCGGGINKAGMAAVSFWISSNPPPYGLGLAEPFLPGGRFAHSLRITPTIGSYDCRKVRCAITVRADHTRDGDRSFDMFIPMHFTPLRK